MRASALAAASLVAAGLMTAPSSGSLHPASSPTVHAQFEWSVPVLSHVDHIAVAPNDDVVVTGMTSDEAYPTTPDAMQGACSRAATGTCRSPFLSILTPSGQLRYSTYVGADSERPIVAVRPLADGGVDLLLGPSESRYNGPMFPSLEPGQPPGHQGCWRALPLLVRLHPETRRFDNARCLDWAGLQWLWNLDGALADDGSTWVVAQAEPWMPMQTTRNAWQPVPPGQSTDLFVLHFGADVQPQLATYIGGSAGEVAAGMAIAADGDLLLGGWTESFDFPAVRPVQPRHGEPGHRDDAFLLRLDVSGRWLEYSTWLGGADQDFARAVALDESGNAFVVGVTTSDDFPVTAGAMRTRNTLGSADAFLASVDPAGRLRFSTLVGASGGEDAHAVAALTDGSVLVVGDTQSADFPQVGPAPSVGPARPFHLFPFLVRTDPLGCTLCRSTLVPVETGHDPPMADPALRALIWNELDAVIVERGYAYLAGHTMLWISPERGPNSNFVQTGGYLKKWRVGGASDREPAGARR